MQFQLTMPGSPHGHAFHSVIFPRPYLCGVVNGYLQHADSRGGFTETTFIDNHADFQRNSGNLRQGPRYAVDDSTDSTSCLSIETRQRTEVLTVSAGAIDPGVNPPSTHHRNFSFSPPVQQTNSAVPASDTSGV